MFAFLVLSMVSVQGAARAPPCAFDGRGYTDMKVTSPSGRELDATSCQKACQLEPTCEFFTHYNNSHMCWLMGKSATLMDQPDPKATSGAKSCTSGVGPGAAITITGDASPDEVAAGVAVEAAAGAPLEPLPPAVEEIHRKAEAAYGRIMDQATKVADMRVVSTKLRGGRKKTTTYWEGNYILMAILLTVYAGFCCVALYQGWLERLQREQQEMQAKLSPPQDLEMASGSESDGASPNKAFGISGASTRILFPLPRETPRVYYEYTGVTGGENHEEP
ncbi:unnamed protein product [Cladocopium goreaui]|uniref:Apple domain-containing protein n=1 Tax=Cladocopium goreaui TaxID=2562237 RepID=A0A9P1GDL8_9DINO|nr:unnamed protein product [Cladocopium goreaui]